MDNFASVVKMKKIVYILIMLFLFSSEATYAQNPTFKTEASSTKMSVDKPFRILFTISNASQISGFDAPQFKGFEVLQNSRSQSISIINGHTSRKLSFVFILRPTAVGRFTIAGASVRINGNPMRSNPITITVVEGNGNTSGNQSQASPSQPSRSQSMPASPRLRRLRNHPAVMQEGQDPMKKIKKNVFVKVVVDKKEVYVGQQITANYKLYTRLPTSSKVVKVPSFSGFSTHDLPVPNPLRPHVEKVDGKQYRVFTFRKTMLFPLQGGVQKLEPVEIQNTVKLYTLEKSQGGGNPFSGMMNDPFFQDVFNDPFFRQAFSGGTQLVPHEYDYNMKSPVVKIDVKSLPEKGKPENFDNAVGQFTIKSSVDKTHLTTDDAVSFTVTISGNGNVNLLSAPDIQFPDNLESYDPKVKDDFHNTNPFGGSRSFTYVLMPNSAGSVTIPAIQFSYFDPEAKKYETIQTQPHTLTIAPGENQSQAAKVTNPATAKNTLLPIRTGEPAWNKTGVFWFAAWWHWLLMLLPIIILIALILWKRKRDALFSNQVLLKNKKANRIALKRLSRAGKYLKQDKSKLFYEETAHAIWGYLCDKLNIPLSELTKQKADDRLKEKNISDAILQSLFALLDRSEMALYAGISGHEHMADTYKEAIKVISELESQIKKIK